jgi:hypothetical protein
LIRARYITLSYLVFKPAEGNRVLDYHPDDEFFTNEDGDQVASIRDVGGSVSEPTTCETATIVEQVGGFLRPPVSSTNKTDRHDITENLLKVVLTTFKQTDKLTIPKTWQHHAMFQLSLR